MSEREFTKEQIDAVYKEFVARLPENSGYLSLIPIAAEFILEARAERDQFAENLGECGVKLARVTRERDIALADYTRVDARRQELVRELSQLDQQAYHDNKLLRLQREDFAELEAKYWKLQRNWQETVPALTHERDEARHEAQLLRESNKITALTLTETIDRINQKNALIEKLEANLDAEKEKGG